jgi:hypothetical protein
LIVLDVLTNAISTSTINYITQPTTKHTSLSRNQKTNKQTKKQPGGWEMLTSVEFDDAITILTKAVCVTYPKAKRKFLEFLAHFYSSQSYYGQRVVATAMLAEFVNQSKEDVPLQLQLIKFLLPQVADKVLFVFFCL